jgi:hypothetical protein
MSNVRKKLFSKNTENQVNKKVATGDTGEPKKKAEQVTSHANPNAVSIKTKELKVEINEKEVDKDQVQKIKEIQEKNIELENELKTLEEDYKAKSKKNIEDIANKNNELDETRKEASNASKKNQNLIIKLKKIEKDITEKYTKVMNIKFINKIKNQQTIQKDIKVREKQIEFIKKKNDEKKEENLKIENLLKNKKLSQKQPNLQKKLNALNSRIKEVTKELEELSNIKSKHIACKRIINKLTIQLNVLNINIEFESKKNELIMSTIVNHKDNKILSEGYEEPVDLTKDKMDYNKKVRDRMLRQKRPPKPKKLAKSASRYIKTEFELIQKSKMNPRKISTNNIFNTPISVIDNEYKEEPNLFTEREAKILKTIIPESYMNEYMGKYQEKKIEKEKIEKKFEEFEEKKNNNMIMKHKIDALKLTIKTKEIIEGGLLAKYRNNNKMIFNLRQEISEYKKKIQEQNNILKRMEKYTIFYNNIINSMKKEKKSN